MFPNLSSWVFIYCHPDLGGWTGGRDYKIVATKMELEFFSGLLGDDGEVVAIVHLHLDVLVHLSGNFRLVKHLGVESLNSVGCTVMISPKFFKLSLHKNIVVFILSTKVLFKIFKIPFSSVIWASFRNWKDRNISPQRQLGEVFLEDCGWTGCWFKLYWSWWCW